MTLFPEVAKGMRSSVIGDRLLTGGGIIPPEDMSELARMGVGRLFGPGASTQDIAQYIREWFAEADHGDGAPAPAARSSAPKRSATPAGAGCCEGGTRARRASAPPAPARRSPARGSSARRARSPSKSAAGRKRRSARASRPADASRCHGRVRCERWWR
jgi:hypothetical protein